MIVNGKALYAREPLAPRFDCKTRAAPPVDYLHLRLSYCSDTGKLFWRDYGKMTVQWRGRFAGREAFTTVGKNGYYFGRIDWVGYTAHRVIWAMHTGAWPAHQIDHINGVRQDNRLCNLREVTQAENSRNSARPRHNTSGHLGVSWDARSRKWVAYVSTPCAPYVTPGGRVKKSRLLRLGYYAQIEDAIAARGKANSDFGFAQNHGRERTHRDGH